MGELRTAIEKLQTALADSPAEIEALKSKRKKLSDRIAELGKKADQGFDLMFMHLTEKFREEGTTLDDKAGTKLKEVMDGDLGGLIKGIVQWQGDIKKLIAQLNTEHQKDVSGLSAQVAQAQSDAAKLQKIAAKKKDKLFKSAKYKTKIKGYLGALDGIGTTLTKQLAAIKKASTLTFNDAWVDRNFRITADMTVADIRARASQDVENQMKVYEANQEEADEYVRVWRDEYKGIAGQLATIRQWSADADDMEKESN